MGKETRPVAYHVEIEPKRVGNCGTVHVPDSWWGSDEEIVKEMKSRCEAIVDQVRRHCDYVGHAQVIAEEESKCSHCGAVWTESNETFNGGCYDADMTAEFKP